MAMFTQETCCSPTGAGIKIFRNMADQGFQLASRLRSLTAELRALEHDLKSGVVSDIAALLDFRHAIDEARLTAWTASELHHAHPERQATLASFLAAERIRRFAQMIRDFSVDLEHQDLTWESGGVQTLFDSVSALQARLERLIREHRATFRNLKDEQG
jgi:hypothetical protein